MNYLNANKKNNKKKIILKRKLINLLDNPDINFKELLERVLLE
jgi:hypothetical protein